MQEWVGGTSKNFRLEVQCYDDEKGELSCIYLPMTLETCKPPMLFQCAKLLKFLNGHILVQGKGRELKMQEFITRIKHAHLSTKL